MGTRVEIKGDRIAINFKGFVTCFLSLAIAKTDLCEEIIASTPAQTKLVKQQEHSPALLLFAL
jgi:hypothetical protein